MPQARQLTAVYWHNAHPEIDNMPGDQYYYPDGTRVFSRRTCWDEIRFDKPENDVYCLGLFS